MKMLKTNRQWIAVLFSVCMMALPAAAQAFYVGEAVDIDNRKTFECNESEQTLLNRGVTHVYIDPPNGPRDAIYIGYRQVSANNQNPIITRFVDGVRQWCHNDLETSGDDQFGYGLLWDGDERLYAVFGATGTQGTSSEDFREYATNGWLRHFTDASSGSSTGGRAAVIAAFDVETGLPTHATFFTARLGSNGKVNSTTVRDMAFTASGGIRLVADSAFAPRNTDKTAMDCTTTPLTHEMSFTADLSTATGSRSTNCTDNSPDPEAANGVDLVVTGFEVETYYVDGGSRLRVSVRNDGDIPNNTAFTYRVYARPDNTCDASDTTANGAIDFITSSVNLPLPPATPLTINVLWPQQDALPYWVATQTIAPDLDAGTSVPTDFYWCVALDTTNAVPETDEDNVFMQAGRALLWDVDFDGVITPVDAMRLLNRLNAPTDYDLNGDGLVTAIEITDALARLGVVGD